MELHKNDMEKLRSHIRMAIEVAEGLPDASIHIEKDVLESLIFEQQTVWYGGKTLKIKFPIYTGKFLRKIDLSEVSFDSVVWDKRKFCEMVGISYKEAWVADCDLSYTNAKIDFSKAIFPKQVSLDSDHSYTPIRRINFSGIDLTSSHIEEIVGAEHTNFNKAKGDFSSVFDKNKHFIDCQFQGVLIKQEPILCREFYGSFNGCDFSDTGIDIICDINREGLNMGKVLGEDIKAGRLNQCYVNGVCISNRLKAIKKEASTIYADYQQQLYATVDDAIQKEIAKVKKS